MKKKIVDKNVFRCLGYLELGMCHEALLEISKLDTLVRHTSAVVEMKMHIFMQLNQWKRALKYSRKLQMLDIENASGYIHEAFCQYELGHTSESIYILENGPRNLRVEPLYFYNLACYKAAIGDYDDAVKYLHRAFKMDSSLKSVANEDKYLTNLKSKIYELDVKELGEEKDNIKKSLEKAYSKKSSNDNNQDRNIGNCVNK